MPNILSYSEWCQMACPYDSETDYRHEVCIYEYETDYKKKGKSFEHVQELFANTPRPPIEPNPFFYKWITGYAYREYVHGQKKSVMQQARAFLKTNQQKLRYMFVTIGFDDAAITPQKMLELSAKVAALSLFSKSEIFYVLERHRHNGIHHHVHFLIKPPVAIGRAQLIQKILQISTMSNFTRENFIDVECSWSPKPGKPMASYQELHNYVHGIKTSSKMEFVERDDEWRIKNDIDKIYKRV